MPYVPILDKQEELWQTTGADAEQHTTKERTFPMQNPSWMEKNSNSGIKFTEANDGMAFTTTGKEEKTTIRKKMLQVWKNRALLEKMG